MYIPGGFLSAYCIDKKGIRFCLITGALIQAFGCWFRYFGTLASGEFLVALEFIGQALCGFSQPFFLNIPTKIAFDFFESKKRGLVTSLMTIGSPLGGAIAFLAVPFLVMSKEDFAPFLLGVSILCSIFIIICSLLLLSKNPNFGNLEVKNERENFYKTLKTLIGIKYYWLLTITFAVGVGLFNSFSVYVTQFISPYEYSNDDAGIIGAVLIFGGIISAAVFGVIVDKTKQHLNVIKFGIPVIILSYFAFAFSYTHKNILPVLCVISATMGIATMALLPAILELASTLTRKSGVGEGLTISLMWMSGQLLGIIYLNVPQFLNTSDSTKSTDNVYTVAVWIMCALITVVYPVILCYPSRLNMKNLIS
ncbi:hypothetical protein HDU92_005369 [Lobulomyces angularis]|nr:hypothetical protein HDU92_005369 [Lobulomyces angularis]